MSAPRSGFEVELLAPRGASRLTLAEHLAALHDGRVLPVWHPDDEPSLVPGLGLFRTLTLGFEVRDADDGPLCRLVDDVTLQADLDAAARPAPGWYRLLTDDVRLLHLLERACDPADGVEQVLEVVSELWGTPVAVHGPIRAVGDRGGATVAAAAPQGGERERACEVVTPVLGGPDGPDRAHALHRLLDVAAALGFTVPAEAAVHVHYDAAPLRTPSTARNLVRLFGPWAAAVRDLLGTNPRCRRLAPLPDNLVAAADREADLDGLAAAAVEGGLGKFHDVNLTALFGLPRRHPERDTVEVRVLPGSIDAAEILRGAALVERLLVRCQDPTPLPAPGPGSTAAALLDQVPAGA